MALGKLQFIFFVDALAVSFLSIESPLDGYLEALSDQEILHSHDLPDKEDMDGQGKSMRQVPQAQPLKEWIGTPYSVTIRSELTIVDPTLGWSSILAYLVEQYVSIVAQCMVALLRRNDPPTGSVSGPKGYPMVTFGRRTEKNKPVVEVLLEYCPDWSPSRFPTQDLPSPPAAAADGSFSHSELIQAFEGYLVDRLMGFRQYLKKQESSSNIRKKQLNTVSRCLGRLYSQYRECLVTLSSSKDSDTTSLVEEEVDDPTLSPTLILNGILRHHVGACNCPHDPSRQLQLSHWLSLVLDDLIPVYRPNNATEQAVECVQEVFRVAGGPVLEGILRDGFLQKVDLPVASMHLQIDYEELKGLTRRLEVVMTLTPALQPSCQRSLSNQGPMPRDSEPCMKPSSTADNKPRTAIHRLKPVKSLKVSCRASL